MRRAGLPGKIMLVGHKWVPALPRPQRLHFIRKFKLSLPKIVLAADRTASGRNGKVMQACSFSWMLLQTRGNLKHSWHGMFNTTTNSINKTKHMPVSCWPVLAPLIIISTSY